MCAECTNPIHPLMSAVLYSHHVHASVPVGLEYSGCGMRTPCDGNARGQWLGQWIQGLSWCKVDPATCTNGLVYQGNNWDFCWPQSQPATTDTSSTSSNAPDYDDNTILPQNREVGPDPGPVSPECVDKCMKYQSRGLRQGLRPIKLAPTVLASVQPSHAL